MFHAHPDTLPAFISLSVFPSFLSSLVSIILWLEKPACAKLADPLMTRGCDPSETIKPSENVFILTFWDLFAYCFLQGKIL